MNAPTETQQFTEIGAPVAARVVAQPLSLGVRRQLLGEVVRAAIVFMVLGLFFLEFMVSLVAVSLGADADAITDILSFGLAPLAGIAGAFAAYFFPSSTASP